MNDLTDEWVNKAENDFAAAEVTLYAQKGPITDAVCFHSQQCAEKYLKAFLQENRIRFEKTHVLAYLLDLCLTLDEDFKIIATDLAELDSYGVAIRYPGTNLTPDYAFRAFETARRVRAFIRGKLNLAEKSG
ncbi:MAG: hypothetical protein ANABAC_1766 [Anaerolineae bacterium]|nr:MAG: hypothetical protein ANABAC_1766 [Anaerolineae bacterium]